MGVSKAVVAMCVIIMVVVIDLPGGPAAVVEGGLTCGQVTGSLGSCVGYLKTGGKLPPPGCCKGVTGLVNLARTTPDRKQACNCLKQIASSVKGINYSAASSLPGRCGVRIPYAISPSIDCNKVT